MRFPRDISEHRNAGGVLSACGCLEAQMSPPSRYGCARSLRSLKRLLLNPNWFGRWQPPLLYHFVSPRMRRLSAKIDVMFFIVLNFKKKIKLDFGRSVYHMFVMPECMSNMIYTPRQHNLYSPDRLLWRNRDGWLLVIGQGLSYMKWIVSVIKRAEIERFACEHDMTVWTAVKKLCIHKLFQLVSVCYSTYYAMTVRAPNDRTGNWLRQLEMQLPRNQHHEEKKRFSLSFPDMKKETTGYIF